MQARALSLASQHLLVRWALLPCCGPFSRTWQLGIRFQGRLAAHLCSASTGSANPTLQSLTFLALTWLQALWIYNHGGADEHEEVSDASVVAQVRLSSEALAVLMSACLSAALASGDRGVDSSVGSSEAAPGNSTSSGGEGCTSRSGSSATSDAAVCSAAVANATSCLRIGLAVIGKLSAAAVLSLVPPACTALEAAIRVTATAWQQRARSPAARAFLSRCSVLLECRSLVFRLQHYIWQGAEAACGLSHDRAARDALGRARPALLSSMRSTAKLLRCMLAGLDGSGELGAAVDLLAALACAVDLDRPLPTEESPQEQPPRWVTPPLPLVFCGGVIVVVGVYCTVRSDDVLQVVCSGPSGRCTAPASRWWRHAACCRSTPSALSSCLQPRPGWHRAGVPRGASCHSRVCAGRAQRRWQPRQRHGRRRRRQRHGRRRRRQRRRQQECRGGCRRRS